MQSAYSEWAGAIVSDEQVPAVKSNWNVAYAHDAIDATVAFKNAAWTKKGHHE